MRHYVHEFRVQMVIEGVPEAGRAEDWMETRLNGGDASFKIEHTGSIRALTPEESDAFYMTGKHPS